MKRIICSALTLVMSAGLFPVFPAAAENENAALIDSGIDYTEVTDTLDQPACGYTSTQWVVCKPGDTPILDPKGNIVLFFIDIGGFSSGINGTTDADGNYSPGTDYDLDETFFDSWQQTLKNARKNGCMVAMRFRYDANGHANPEPASFDKVLDHIRQIKESRILEDNKDILAFVESGFVGKWGEQHGGKYTTVEYKAQLLDAMLDCVPENIPVTVRTPDTFAEWAGIKRSELDDVEHLNGYDSVRYLSKRVGLYDDGYMGSDSDLGTYADRKAETDWLNYVTTNTYFGGEFSGDLAWAQKFDTYLPENAIPEMYKTHLSYINGNIFQLYKDYIFGEEYDVPGADNSAYYGQSVFKFIRDHIGYRFVLRDSDLSASAVQGGQAEIDFTVENTGFANPVPEVHAQAILEKDGSYISAPVDINCNKWFSCTQNQEKLLLQLPGSIRTGEWKVYLRLSMGENGLDEMNSRSVKFANNNVYSPLLGANYLGTLSVTQALSCSTDNTFRQAGSETGSTDYFRTANTVIIDGIDTYSGEWSESDVVTSSENGQNISVRADDQYIYIRSSMPEGADAPVYNLQLKNPQRDNEHFWLYYASNGFVYFNHPDKTGCDCKWNGNTVEFRIPLGDETWGFRPGDTISGLRVFLQDSGNDWKLMGDITAQSAVIPASVRMYSSDCDLRLESGSDFTIRAFTPVKNATFQWYIGDTPIESADSQELLLKNVDSSYTGLYSVKVTSPDGASALVPIADIIEVSDTKVSTICGDADLNGAISVSDVVAVLQYSANSVRYPLYGQALINADTNKDGDVNASDAYLIQQCDAGIITLS